MTIGNISARSDRSSVTSSDGGRTAPSGARTPVTPRRNDVKIDAGDPGTRSRDGAALGLRVAIIAAEFNAAIVVVLVVGARDALLAAGASPENLPVVRVPGAWELPLAALGLVDEGGYDGIVALGCVIRGETAHFDFVAGAAMDGLLGVMLDHRIPIGLGVLTTEDELQAQARAGGKHGNKGEEAAHAALDMIGLLKGRA